MSNNNEIKKVMELLKANPDFVQKVRNEGGFEKVFNSPVVQNKLDNIVVQTAGTRRRRRNSKRSTSKRGSRRSHRRN